MKTKGRIHLTDAKNRLKTQEKTKSVEVRAPAESPLYAEEIDLDIQVGTGQGRLTQGGVRLDLSESALIQAAISTYNALTPNLKGINLSQFIKRAILGEAHRLVRSDAPLMELEDAVKQSIAALRVISDRAVSLNECSEHPMASAIDIGTMHLVDVTSSRLMSAFESAHSYAAGRPASERTA